MRIGYSFWGFLGDYKIENGSEVSTPDGNATYSWSIIWEAMNRGHSVFPMQTLRDLDAVKCYEKENFASFSKLKRWRAFNHLWENRGDIYTNTSKKFPELDVLLLEWRFPIPGRNTPEDVNSPHYQPDLQRQRELIDHYQTRGTPIIIWDLDHKLTKEEEESVQPAAIFETSKNPRRQIFQRIRVEPPIVVEDLLYQYPMERPDLSQMVSYVGSRYERDDVIDEWMKPVSERYPWRVHFWGNWEKTLDECKAMWPLIRYHRRITPREFREAYGKAVACPLLAKRSYLQTGFVTPRVWEALMFGTIPIGLGEHHGIEDYVLYKADDAKDMCVLLDALCDMSPQERERIREKNVEKISFMDVKHFVDKIEEVVNRH